MIDAPPLPTISRTEAERGRFFDGRPPVVREFLADRSPMACVHGPLGTGKTRMGLERIRACCLRYPRCRWLLLRSVRKWLTQSALVTWEEKVIVPGEMVPDRIHRSNRSEYRFRNGSIVVVAGLDDPQQVMSAEYDGAFIVEATEVNQATAETVGGRLRNGRMPYQPLFFDCNPAAPTHWLRQGMNDGRIREFAHRHQDNPHLWDPVRQEWTAAGKAYMARLDSLTGNRRLRLRDGRWASAEGLVYEAWDPTVHVIDPFDIPAHWDRYWAIDFGYTNPLVWQWWAEDPDGRIYLYREIYKTGQIVRDACGWAKRLSSGEPRVRACVTDHDPEAQAQIEAETGIIPESANKNVEVGIQAVQRRLPKAGDGRPRLFVFRNALAHLPDQSLIDQAKPTSTVQEFDGYVWDPKAKAGERPLKQNDHGADCTRYLAMYRQDGPVEPGGYGSPGEDEQPTARLPAGTFR